MSEKEIRINNIVDNIKTSMAVEDQFVTEAEVEVAKSVLRGDVTAENAINSIKDSYVEI